MQLLEREPALDALGDGSPRLGPVADGWRWSAVRPGSARPRWSTSSRPGSSTPGRILRGASGLQRLDARPLAAAVARKLRELGVRGLARGPRPTTRANPANLTPREAEVLALVTEGLLRRTAAATPRRTPCRATWSNAPSRRAWPSPSTTREPRPARWVVDGNATEGVTWVHSYVTTDKRTTFCIYDGPSLEAIRRAATTNQLPVDRITEVRVLDPYFYR